MALSKKSKKLVQSLIGIAVLAGILFLFVKSGLREQMSRDNLLDLGANPWTPVLIIVAMTGAWAYALPASVFFFITPLLFPPLAATAVICAGTAAGTTM